MEERLLELLLLALKYGATDIHFKSVLSETCIDMRINGMVYKVKEDKMVDGKLIRYLQYLASLDVGHLKEPQTGQFEMEVDKEIISLRFSVINNTNYSDGVLRILNSKLNIDVNKLSLYKDQNEFFKSLLENTHGLVVFSGPTGSGKTTTLYSLLNSLNHKKIYTIEDPIEVYNDKFVQLEINEEANFGYEEGIKQLMRHDPDIIMIGEIRDVKAATYALQAAYTGHLVLTTIHASSSTSTINRLISMGLNEDHLYEELLCVSNQRMAIGLNDEKHIIYEIMDEKEIKYFRENKENSKNFRSLRKQIDEGFINDTFKSIVK